MTGQGRSGLLFAGVEKRYFCLNNQLWWPFLMASKLMDCSWQETAPCTLKMADVKFSEEATSLTLNYSEVVQAVKRPRRNEQKSHLADKTV